MPTADPADLGASELSEGGDGYVVMFDPEENEFCVVADKGGGWKGTLRRALDGGA